MIPRLLPLLFLLPACTSLHRAGLLQVTYSRDSITFPMSEQQKQQAAASGTAPDLPEPRFEFPGFGEVW